MKIGVDRGLCQGHAQCQDAAPEVFEVRDDGFAHVLLEETEDPELIERVLDGARRCPVDAVLTSGEPRRAGQGNTGRAPEPGL